MSQNTQEYGFPKAANLLHNDVILMDSQVKELKALVEESVEEKEWDEAHRLIELKYCITRASSELRRAGYYVGARCTSY